MLLLPIKNYLNDKYRCPSGRFPFFVNDRKRNDEFYKNDRFENDRSKNDHLKINELIKKTIYYKNFSSSFS